MDDGSRRPFYTEYAWAYDLLIDRPVRKECAAIVSWLVERGVVPGARLLDAGCGTGRYASELGRRGYIVHGIDTSPEFVAIATRAAAGREETVSFAVADILTLPPAGFDAILCRGVLNDVIESDHREAAFAAFARALRAGGLLMLDVREWEGSAERKAREPVFRKRVATDRGTLTFTSITELDRDGHRLLVSERHTLIDGNHERSTDFHFVMRCWTRDELDATLTKNGFGAAAYFGAYDATVEAGATDRLVAVAQLLRA
jgi:SAM-dependent methyltransferase